MWISLQDGTKEGRAGGEDHLVGLDLKKFQWRIRYLEDDKHAKNRQIELLWDFISHNI